MKKLYHFASQLNLIFWERVAQSVQISESSLGIFRWIFGCFLLFIYMPEFAWISDIPDAFFDPPYISIANLFSQFPNAVFFYTIDILIVVSVFFLTVGIKARLFSYILLIGWFLGNNFNFSLGKIDHNIMILVVLLCMGFSNWGAYYALLPERLKPSYYSTKALALLSVILSFGMLTGGGKKVLNWIDFDFQTSGFLSWFYPRYYNFNDTAFLAPAVLEIPTWIFEFADYAAAIFEVSAFIALLHSRKGWLFWLFIACMFHWLNVLLLNIFFIVHFTVYLAFVDFAQLKERIFKNKSLFSNNQIKYLLTGIVLSSSVVHLLNILLGREFNSISLLYSSVVMWPLAAMLVLSNLLMPNKAPSKS